MDKLIVGKMYYVSESSIEDAEFKRFMKIKVCLCKCTSKRGKFKIRDGVYRYMKYWVAEKEAKMEKRVSDAMLSNLIAADGVVFKDIAHDVIWKLSLDLRDARKELEEAKKDSVWRDVPPGIGNVNVNWFSEGLGLFSVNHTRNLPKTPKQELIDKFAEKNAFAMKCANLSKEILEAFAKEYEEAMK